MATIVEYTDHKTPQNHYPTRIISPSRSSACCYAHMHDIGLPQTTARWEFLYKRCRTCGFTIRLILRPCPDLLLAARLRQALSTVFERIPPR
jgi:hypothetical protein